MVEDFEKHAATVLASISNQPPAAVRMLSQALAIAGGPLGAFAHSFDVYADVLEHPEFRPSLALLCMARAIRLAATFEPVLEQLADAQGEPWESLRGVLEEIGGRDG